MKVAIYCRVSTDEQNATTQETICREYCERNKYEIFKVYTDTGFSGAKTSRPAFDEMLKDMRLYKFNGIMVISWTVLADPFSISCRYSMNFQIRVLISLPLPKTLIHRPQPENYKCKLLALLRNLKETLSVNGQKKQLRTIQKLGNAVKIKTPVKKGGYCENQLISLKRGDILKDS